LIARSEQVKLGLPVHVPCEGVTVPRVNPAGHVSARDTAAAVDGPALLTVIVYVRTIPSPAVTLVTPSDLVTERSAWLPTLVVAVAVLLPGVLSFGDDTVALLVIEPGVAGASTTIVMSGAAPGARFPPVRLQVTVPATLLQAQFAPVALTNVVPAGSVSTTFTADASLGPALLTPIV
jgi:hypothetical protein